MKQQLQTRSAPERSTRGTVAGRSFNVLFALAGSDYVDASSLGYRLGMSEGEYTRVVEDLHRRYLVDVVSGLEGDRVRERLHLTEEGRAALLQSMEQMCELPEIGWNSLP